MPAIMLSTFNNFKNVNVVSSSFVTCLFICWLKKIAKLNLILGYRVVHRNYLTNLCLYKLRFLYFSSPMIVVYFIFILSAVGLLSLLNCVVFYSPSKACTVVFLLYIKFIFLFSVHWLQNF